MKKLHYSGLILFIFLVLLSAFWSWGRPQTTATASSLSPQEAVEQAWSLAHTSGRYNYRSLVDQTVYPAPSVANAGRPPRQDRLAVEGEVDVATETLNLTLWNDGSFDPQRGLSVKVEDGQAYGRRGAGNWQEIDNVADAFAPGGDPLGFLAGAANIQTTGAETRNFDGASLVYTHYTFEMDGRAFADYMLAEIEAHQEKYGALPAGMELAPPEIYQRLTGQGELWINEAGLPARLEIQVEIPDQPKAGERVTAVISNDFFGFDLAHLQQVAVPFWADPHHWVNERLPQIETAVQSAVPVLQLIVFCLLVGILSLRYWRTRRFYAAVISLIIVSMLVSPMLQAHHAEAFMERLTADQETQQARQVEAEQRQAVDEAIKNRRNWNANENPLAIDKEQAGTSGKPVAAGDERSILAAPLTTNAALGMMQVSATDSDGDGLSDEDEAYWGTCAYTFGSPDYNNSADCTGVADPTDSDGDGLSDSTEVNYLNTYPTSADTDGDTITDTLEIEGFEYNGRTWYLNPVDEDTNGDGLVDSGECNLLAGSGAADLAAACPDTDNDGEPDFADPDNDGDGILDRDDMSPNRGGDTIYDNDNPFLLTINNFTIDQPILVDIQLRPDAPDHLDYYNHILDWPLDDEGQIQRHLNTTWATTANTEYQSDAPNAANGDIRLIPMLEIRMPYSSGHYANLPVNSVYAGTSRPLGVAVDEWLDEAVTGPYSMSVDDLDLATGDLVTYVPLSLASDDNNSPIGYTTRLIYQPGQPAWGAAHEYRVVWLVQMLTDACIDPEADPATCAREDVVTVIHSYDETWTLTGLNISEEHGMDVALMHENPAQDDNLDVDDQLWGASWNLGNTFLRGRDCDSFSGGSCVGNGQRDVTIANLSNNLATWNLDYTEVNGFSYPHQGFTAYIMMTETVALLDAVFTPYVNQTVPTILVAQEHRSRVVNLDSYEGDLSSGMTADLSPAANPLHTQASLSWASYEYANGEWQNYEPEAYLEYLSEKLATDSFFQPIDSSQTAEDTAEGKLLWAQTYYAMLYSGAHSVVQGDNTVIWQPSVSLPETSFDPLIPVNVNWGTSTIANEFAVVYASKKISVSASESGIWAWFKRNIHASADDGVQFTRFNRGGLSTNYVALAVLAVAAIGATVLAVGLLTGDKTMIRAGVVIMSIVTIIVTVFYIITAIQKIVRIITTMGLALRTILAAGRWFQGVGVIGFILGVVITWGAVGVLILSKGLKGIALGIALSLAIAATIILVIYLIFDLIGVGIFTYFMILLDALFALFGAKGPTQLLTEFIAASLYGVQFLIKNMEDSERLALDLAGFAFVDDELGFTVQNSFIFTIAVTNTLRYDNDYSFSTLEDRTVFRYFLQSSETDQHGPLNQGEMIGEWVAVDGNKALASEVLNITIPMGNLGAGIAQSLDGEMYVTEAYIAPYEGCWKFAGIPTDCTWYKFSGSSHINLGQELVYDILPNNLSTFARMRWDSQLPIQSDIDNDGLNSADGTDPAHDDSDGDGDGLSDYFETIYGLDPNNADSDGDGLNDAQELIHGTNPFAADSDSDGLNDYIETVTGWLVVYKNYDQPYLTRVWSDPNSPDADGDSMNDLEEFIFGFHPQVKSDPNDTTGLVRFNNLEVVEDSSLISLTRFEETAASSTFFDSSGLGHRATCDQSGGTCPTLEQVGRYGYAPAFNYNHYLTINSADPLFSEGQFTEAAWINPTATSLSYLGILGYQGPGGEANRAPGIWLYNHHYLHVGFGDGTNWHSYTTPGEVITTDAWNHIATTFDGTTFRIYVNGAEVYQTTDWAGIVPYQTTSLDVGRVDNFFSGRIDEVALFDRALSAEEIGEVMNGRYNVNDLILAPGADLTYHATVTNTSATNVNGFLSADTEYLKPEIPRPATAFSFEPEQKRSFFHNDRGNENSITCQDDGSCPTAGSPGKFGSSIAFDGVDDYAELPALGNGGHIHFWLWIDSLPPAGQTAAILDTADELENDIDIVLNSAGQLIIERDGTVAFTSSYNFSSHLNEWVHISLRAFNFYINGNGNGSPSLLDRTIGYGRLGNSLDGSEPFDGRIDELVSLNANDGSGGGTSYNEIMQHIMAGEYEYTNGTNDDFHTYDFLYRFDELINYDGTIFYDAKNSNHATCSSATCPVLSDPTGGQSGRAVTFDGVDDYLTQPGEHTTDQHGNVTVSFYVYMSSYPSTNAYIFDTASGTDVLDMYITPAGQFVATREEGTHTSVGSIPLNQWVEVRLQYAKFFGSCWTYESRIHFNAVSDSTQNYHLCSNPTTWDIALTIGSGRIGNSMAGTNPFGGVLDSLNFAVSTIDFDPPSADAGFDNLANDLRAASCDDVFICPSVAPGRFDQGLSFDGVEEYLRLDKVVDPAAGDFTAAVWFKAANASSEPVVLTQIDSSGVGRVWLALRNDGRLSTFLGGSTLIGSTLVTANTWHHAAVTYDGVTLRLYLNGTLEASAVRTMEANNGDMWLGRHKSQTNRYFSGLMDELVILPAAVNGAGVQMLMNSTWPAIDIPALFETFSVAALTNLEVSGTAEINPYALTSIHQFDQEIEAALELQAQIDYPVVDGNAASLGAFFPFEETPGSAVFENLIAYNDGADDVEATCNGDACPTAGLRGQVDRAVYFDGLNDYLNLNLFGVANKPNIRSISVWLNGKQGTILNICSSTNCASNVLELDMNQMYHRGTQETIPLDLPRKEWFHLVVTVDSSDVARVYVNGSEVTTSAINDNYQAADLELLMIGADRIVNNLAGQDFYEGYMDDLRLYETVLTPATILTLYKESAPVLRFEFDEDSDASVFVDNSVNNFVGQPTIETCATLNLDTLSVNSLAETPSSVFVTLDDEWLLHETDRAAGDSLTPDIEGVLCGQQSLSVGVSTNGTPTILGTVNLDIANPGTAVQTFSGSGSSVDLSWTVDGTPIYQPNPAPGTSGRIANGALFDGEGFVTVTETVPLNLSNHDFTVAAWIKTTASDVGILTKDDGDNNWEPGEKAFYLDASGYLNFATQGNFMRANTAVNDGHWHYVVAVWDYSGTGVDGTGHIYIDGVDVTTIDSYTAFWLDNPDDTLKIGGEHFYSGVFTGQIDELTAYQRALTEAELYSIYLREIRWYRDRTTSYLKVDSDAPTVELLSDALYRPNGYTQLAVATTDPTSYVSVLDFGLKGPNDGGFVWQGAPQCRDNGVIGAAWCPFFDTTTLGGEGRYELQFRAVDAVGNEATSPIYIFYVDDTPPAISGNYTGQWGPITDQDDKRLNWTVTLIGTVGDPVLNTTPVFDGSGLVTNTVQVTMVDAVGGLIGEGSQQATVNGSDWSIDYKMTGARPQGTYTITVSIEDKVGNTADVTIGTVQFDERPPRAIFNRWEVSEQVISDTVTLRGAVADQADWGGEAASYAFEEAGGASIFYDSSENGVHLNCTNCPTLVSNGRFGQALNFDGLDDVLTRTNTGTNTPFDNNLTLSLWLRPHTLEGIERIITLGNFAGGIYIGVFGELVFFATIDGLSYELSAANLLSADQWQHIAGTYDGQTMRLYYNGLEVESLDIAGELNHTSEPLETMFFGGAAEPYDGQIDEVAIYHRSLSDAEIYALAQLEEAGTQSVEIGLEPFDFTESFAPFAPPTWSAATVVNGSWSYTIPPEIEGFYNIHLRTTDNFGNISGEEIIWRGILDVKAPEIIASGQHIGSGSASQTLYTFAFSDFILNEASYDQPCGENELVSQTYNDALLPHDGMAYQVTASCRVAGHEVSRDFTVCDAVGHCTTQTVFPALISEDEDSIAILDPINLSEVEAGEMITISGGAFDVNWVTMIVISVDGVVIDTQNYSTLPDVMWDTDWTPMAPGTVTVAAAMTDFSGNTITDTIQLIVEPGSPTAVTLQSGAVRPTANSAANLALILILFGLLTLATMALWRRRKKEELPTSPS